MSDYSKHRRNKNRCEALKVENGGTIPRRRSWRCQLVLGHEGPHISFSGHRSWPQDEDKCPGSGRAFHCVDCGRIFFEMPIPDHKATS